MKTNEKYAYRRSPEPRILVNYLNQLLKACEISQCKADYEIVIDSWQMIR